MQTSIFPTTKHKEKITELPLADAIFEDFETIQITGEVESASGKITYYDTIERSIKIKRTLLK